MSDGALRPSTSRIQGAFARARAEGRAALIPYVTVGYPDLTTTLDLVPALVQAGADLVELGVPFSDPLADGATIQRASHAALSNGITLGTCLETASRLRARVSAPLLLMGYYNPFLRYGPERFCRDAAAAGVDGLIVPDLPPEEAEELRTPARLNGLDIIFLIAPTSPEPRIGAIARLASGFLYCVSLAGVTGARQGVPAGLADLVARIRRQASLPVAVGFGVSQPEQVAAIARIADGVIVGSALIERLEQSVPGERVSHVASYVATLRTASKRTPPAI